MLNLILVFCVTIWCIVGIKTWAFVLTGLTDKQNRLSVMVSFIGALFWPLTYCFLTVLFVSGVLTKRSIEDSWEEIRTAWK